MMDEMGPDGDVSPGTFTMVQYHVSDSYTTSFGNQRRIFYGLTGTPLAWFDGVIECGGAMATSEIQYNWYMTQYNVRHPVPTDVTIELNATEISADTHDVHVKVCLEPGGSAKSVKLYVAQLLDFWPTSPSYHRNTHRQTAVASPAPISLVPGECHEVTYTFTMDAISMANQEDIKIVAWVQGTAASAPAETYQAAEMTWPFPSAQSACPNADVNEDGTCDGSDVATVRNSANWLKDAAEAAVPRADVNDDGVIDGSDIAVIRRTDCWLK
jgi:hypothetical protein